MRPLTLFLRDESGAVAVDWTVMAASVVGLGMASVGAVRSGVGSLGGNVQSSLSGAGVASLRWMSSTLVASQSFDDGNFDGWSAARPGTFGAWGAMQGPFGLDTMTTPLTYNVALTGDATNALVAFDLIIADTWDGLAAPNNPWTRPGGDVLSFQIDGQTISTEAFVHSTNHPGYAPALYEARSGTVDIGGTTYNVHMTPTNLPTPSVGGSASPDQRWRVSIEALNAPQSFQLGFSASVTQAASNESFGLANFTVNQN